MELKQQLIPVTNKTTRPGIPLTPTFITIHETDNPAKGANAQAHANLQSNGNTRVASWHVTVDDREAIQSIPFNEVAWHAGDGANGQGNRNSIAIEICVNIDGDYKKAVANCQELVKQLMSQFNIPVENVVQHNHWSGKNCPSIMRSGKVITWDEFITGLKPAPIKPAAILNGWVQEKGIWYFYQNNVKLVNNWAKDKKGLWYYLGADGSMQVNKWIKWKDKWCYVGADGACYTGGKKMVDGKPYYFQEDGYIIITNTSGVIING